MDDFYPNRKPNMVKLESELILDSDIEAGAPFTVSYQKASDHDPSETFFEESLAFPGKIEVNMLNGLPSIPRRGSSRREAVTMKIKEELMDGGTSYPESSVDNRQNFSPALQEACAFPEEFIKLKVDDDIAEESDAPEETQRHLDFTRGDPEMEVDGLQYRKMSLTSCSEDKGIVDFPVFSAGVAQKTGNKAENEDLLTDESVFLHSEHFPRLSNCKLDSENGSFIDSPSVLSSSADNAVKRNRISTAQNYTESTPSEETLSEACSVASMPCSDFSSPDTTLSEERPFSCEQCPAQFKTKSELKGHLVIHSNEKPFACTQCSARFKRKSELKSHIIMKHSDEKAFACDQCSARYKKKGHLRRHLAIHSNKRAFSCDQCSAQFNVKNHLRYHLLAHSSERAFSCHECSAQFTLKGNLNKHLLTHANERAFSCNQCSAQFNRKDSLKLHLLSHSSEKALTCDQCSAQFKHRNNLRQHLLTHSDMKPFSCNLCSAQFKIASRLRRHLLTHSKREAFSSNRCSAQVNKKHYLKRHSSKRIYKKDFFCNQCSTQFKSMQTLGGHLLEHLNGGASICNQ